MLHGNKSYALHSNYQFVYLIAVDYDSWVASDEPSLFHPTNHPGNSMTMINPISLINTKVQPFKAQAFKQGKFIEVTDKDL